MANEIIKGSDLMVFQGGKSLAYATNCSLKLGSTTASISSKDHGKWEATKPVKFNWEMSSENLYTEEDFGTLFNAWKAGLPVDIVFDLAKESETATDPDGDGTVAPELGWTPKGGVGSKGLKGKAYITSIDVNAPDGDNATYSVTFMGAGELSPNVTV